MKDLLAYDALSIWLVIFAMLNTEKQLSPKAEFMQAMNWYSFKILLEY